MNKSMVLSDQVFCCESAVILNEWLKHFNNSRLANEEVVQILNNRVTHFVVHYKKYVKI